MEERVLILAPRGRDAQVIERLVLELHFKPLICGTIDELTEELCRGAGTGIIAEEALYCANLCNLFEWLREQGAWSDFPFVLLAARQLTPRAPPAQAVVRDLGNVVALERPISADTLASAVDSALRARRRQYQTRDHLHERERAEERLRLALDAGRMGAWELDLSTWHLDASQTCKRVFGRASDREFTYEELLDSIHSGDRERHLEAMRAAVTNAGALDIEYRISSAQGAERWVQMRGQCIVGSRGEPHMIGVSADITQRRNADTELRISQQALKQLNETLETRIAVRTRDLARANDRLVKEIAERERAQAALVQSQKMEAVGQLTNGIAHDFNNLLTAIVGNVDLIARRTADERVKRLAGYAMEAADRASRLTGQLLAFSRTQKLDLRAVAVDELIAGMRDLLRRSIGPSIEITTRLSCSTTRALADANQLELAILNLAINARDAMPAGGTLRIATEQRETAGPDLSPGTYIVIAITDTGAGVPPHLQQKVFEPFFTTKPIGKGTGLGLSQVYGIAHQSGGTARLASTLGQGTTVELWLPVSNAIPESEERYSADDPLANIARGETVLVVEDDCDVRRFIVECLRNFGYRVSEAQDGQSGLETLRQHTPDVLIVDFAMPGVNGAEVATTARTLYGDLPIVFVTGYADMDAVERVTGTKFLLRKPFDVASLANIVRDAVQHREQVLPSHRASGTSALQPGA